MKLNSQLIIKLLKDSRWQARTLYEIEKHKGIPYDIINELINLAIYESDVSANGYLIKTCIQELGFGEVSKRVMSYALLGSDEERMGAIKLFYWIRYDAFIWDQEDIDSIQTTNSFQITQDKVLFSEYEKCKNPVLRFYFKWALPNNSLIKENEPQTTEDLYEKIKHDESLVKLFESLRKKKKEEEKDYKYIFLENFLFEYFSNSLFYDTKTRIDELSIEKECLKFFKKYLQDSEQEKVKMLLGELENITANNDWQYLLNLNICKTKSVQDLKLIGENIIKHINATINGGE